VPLIVGQPVNGEELLATPCSLCGIAAIPPNEFSAPARAHPHRPWDIHPGEQFYPGKVIHAGDPVYYQS